MKFFETASFHIVKPCNMKCKFCYATFDDMTVANQIQLTYVYDILEKLKEAGLQKITFAGGEPLLYRYITHAIEYAHAIGLTTSIITNGSLLLNKIDEFENLDWIGLSIDSLNPETNKLIGRTAKHDLNYYELVDAIHLRGHKLKINTVVNRFNQEESMQKFIDEVNPERWKIFDTLRVEGQNDKQFEEIRSTDNGFNRFVARHQHNSMVPENNELMTGSYLLISPKGELYENSKGIHTYSDPLQHNTVDHCLSQINLNRDMFVKRGGIYQW